MKLIAVFFSTVFAFGAVTLEGDPICIDEGQCETKEKGLGDAPGNQGEWASPGASHGEETPSVWDDDGGWGDDRMGGGSWVSSTPPVVSGRLCNVDGTIVAVPLDLTYEDDDGDGVIEVYISVPYNYYAYSIISMDPTVYVGVWARAHKNVGPILVTPGPCN